MRDITADLQERLEVTVTQRNRLCERLKALGMQEERLRALLREERAARADPSCDKFHPVLNEAASGARLREFVLGSLEDGRDWSLDDLKEHARGLGIMTAGAFGRSLNIVLVNLLRTGVVTRQKGGRWRLRKHARQLSFELTTQTGCREIGNAGARRT